MQPIIYMTNVEVNKARIYSGRCSTIDNTFLPFFYKPRKCYFKILLLICMSNLSLILFTENE